MLLDALLRMGVPQPDALAAVAHASAARMDPPGSLSRVAQLEFGIANEIITQERAVAMVREQPECLRRDFGAAYEDEALVGVNKPWDVKLRLTKPPAWAGEIGLDHCAPLTARRAATASRAAPTLPSPPRRRRPRRRASPRVAARRRARTARTARLTRAACTAQG